MCVCVYVCGFALGDISKYTCRVVSSNILHIASSARSNPICTWVPLGKYCDDNNNNDDASLDYKDKYLLEL